MSRQTLLGVGLCLVSTLAAVQARAVQDSARQVYGLAWALPVAPSGSSVPELLSPRWKSRQFSSPLFHRPTGLVFVGSTDRVMRAYSLDRTLVWSFTAGGAIGSVPVVGDSYLYFGADDGQLYALEPSTGEKIWTHEGDAEITGQVRISGNLLYFSTALDTVYCIEANTGEYRWHVRHPQPIGISLFGNATPALTTAFSSTGAATDVLAMGYADGSLAVLEAGDGKLLWKAELGKGDAFYDVDADPVVVGNLLVAASHTGGVTAFDLATGVIRWHNDVQGLTRLGTDGRVIVGAGAGKAIGLGPKTGKTLWSYQFDQGTASRLVFDGDRVLFNSDIGPTYILDLFSGERLQIFGSPLGMAGQPAVIDDLLLVYSNGGTLYALSSAFAGWAHK